MYMFIFLFLGGLIVLFNEVNIIEILVIAIICGGFGGLSEVMFGRKNC